MLYLFTQTFFWLLAAFLLGLVVGWWLRSALVSDTTTKRQVEPQGDESAVSQADIIPDSWAPEQLYDSHTTGVDDLKKIEGIGLKVEVLLNTLGIYKFEQIAAMTSNNIAWINDKLGFDERIEEEQWVDQARTLASGGETDFSRSMTNSDNDILG